MISGVIPIVETERLIMRGSRSVDFAFYRELRADPEVARYTGGEPLSEEDSWTQISAVDRPLVGDGLWLLAGGGT